VRFGVSGLSTKKRSGARFLRKRYEFGIRTIESVTRISVKLIEGTWEKIKNEIFIDPKTL